MNVLHSKLILTAALLITLSTGGMAVISHEMPRTDCDATTCATPPVKPAKKDTTGTEKKDKKKGKGKKQKPAKQKQGKKDRQGDTLRQDNTTQE